MEEKKTRFLVFSNEGNYWSIHNKKDEFLGILYLDPQWKKLIWEFEGYKFDSECLDDISTQLKALKEGKQ